MKMKGRILCEEEMLNIHQDSIRILEEVGVKFPSHEALEILVNGGARVDWDKQIAYLSEEMVRDALLKAPKQFILGARNPELDVKLPSDVSLFNMDGCGVNALDFHTGQRRAAVLQDIVDSSRVFEELEGCNVYWPPVSPSDVANAGGIVRTGTAYMNMSKHLMDEVIKKEEVPYLMEMCSALAGGREAAKGRNLYSATYCTVAPLCHDKDMLEATMELSRFMAPILVYPMPACGTTGPASLRSNLAQANAEALSAIVIFQLTSPGVPLLYGAALGVVNVRSGLFLEGAVETAMQMAAMGEIGKYYGFPTMSAGCLTDAKAPGMQAVMEKVLTTVPLVMSEIDVVQGIGLIESSMTLSLEQMVIDSEIANLCRRMKDGIDMGEDKDFFEDIKEVGPGGHFLKQKNTRAAFRSDQFYHAALCDRNSYDGWVDLGRPDMYDQARKKVTEILAAEPKHPLPETTEKQLREIMQEAERKLGE